jgi:tetratricopeptide (TPR) repeat protein
LATEYLTWAGQGSADEHERLALAALPLLEATGDYEGLSEVWLSLARGVYNGRCELERIRHAVERGLHYAVLAGFPANDRGYRSVVAIYGPDPVPEALDEVEALLGAAHSPFDGLARAQLLAMSDRHKEAQIVAAEMAAHIRELGFGELHQFQVAAIDSLGGNHESAAERLRIVIEFVTEHGGRGYLSSFAPMRGRELCMLGRYEEAWPLAMLGRDIGLDDDAMTQIGWRETAALVQASRGEHGDAERLAREAVEHAERTDSPLLQADAYFDLGEVVAAAGRGDEAVAAFGRALELYEHKGVVPLIRRTRERLAAFEPITP